MINRKKTRITIEIYEDTLEEIKKISENKRYSRYLREILDIGLHFYKKGARITTTIEINKKEKKQIKEKVKAKEEQKEQLNETETNSFKKRITNILC